MIQAYGSLAPGVLKGARRVGRRARVVSPPPGRLERWHERAILAASIVEVIDEPS